jgi:hypothetical protein
LKNPWEKIIIYKERWNNGDFPMTNIQYPLIISFFLAFLLCFPTMAWGQQDDQIPSQPLFTEGQILYGPLWGTTTYLINKTGAVNHSWSNSYMPGADACWLGDNTILRTIRCGVGPGGGAGGGVQKQESDGTITWDFRYNSNGHLSHHDAEVLPNGNVLLIAWETISRTQAIAAGRNPNYINNQGIMPDHVIEVQPTGSTSGDIVWEWHVWDHLIQDYDSAKANYGVVADHPELVDVNYNPSTQQDWMHTNSIDYNAAFDQILISVHNFGEIWIIDHSTTTEESAGHTGGQYGKGGDLLYRWGNPAVYRAGTSSNKKLFSQHDTHWIPDGLPGAGDILIFNNGADRPGSHYSTVDQLTTPVDSQGEYYLAPGSAYGPEDFTWEYKASPPTSLFSSHLSGVWRLASGNTIVLNGEAGQFFEITSSGQKVWQWTNPYPQGGMKEVFNFEFIPPLPPQAKQPNLDCSGQLTWTKVKPGETVTGSFNVRNIGNSGSLLNWTVNTSQLTWGNWTFSPVVGKNLTPEAGPIAVHVSVVAPQESDQTFDGYIRVENQDNASDYDLISVSMTTPANMDRHYPDMGILRLLSMLFSRFLEHWFLPFERMLGLYHIF